MKVADLIQQMTEAGAPIEAILIAVRAIEDREGQIEARKAADRERKRRQRERDKDGTVTGQSQESHADSHVPPPLSAPPNDIYSNPPHHTPPKKTNRARACRLPDDWEPSQFGPNTKSGAIVAGWPPDQLATQIEHFRAHHRGKGSTFANWQDAWSTWVLNSVKFGKPQSQSRGGSLAEIGDEVRRLYGY